MGAGLAALTVLNTTAMAAAPAVTARAAPAAGAGAASDPAAEKPVAYSFAFSDADIARVADQILGQALKLDYTVDPSVTGRMTFRIDDQMTRAQLLQALESALATSGVAMVRNGDRLLLTSRAKANASGDIRQIGDGLAAAGYGVVAVPLSFASPSQVAAVFKSLGAENLVVTADDKTGLLVLGGTPRELASAQQTLKIVDQSSLGDTNIRWFNLTQASADTVAAELSSVLQAAGTDGVTVVALKRLNGLLVFGRTPQALDEVARWISRLDIASKEEASSLWVYHPRNVDAESLGKLVSQLVGAPSPMEDSSSSAGTSNASTRSSASSGPATPPAAVAVAMGNGPSPAALSPALGGSQGVGQPIIRVAVDKDSNTLAVSAPASRWLQIQRALDQIDRTPSQVLIEATILEVTLGNEYRFGVDLSALDSSGKLAITSSADKSGTVANLFPGLGVSYITNNVQAAIDALSSQTDVEVISSPKMVVRENRTAKLQVGDQVPVVTQTSQGTSSPGAPLVVSTDYKDTGVILNVTPRINSDNQVLLDISQQVSSVAKTTTSGIDSPTIQTRQLESSLVIHDGATVALGGLISSNHSNGNTGVPGLRSLPVLGALFGTTSQNQNRTELIVLLKVSIMPNPATTEKVMGDLLNDMLDLHRYDLLPAR
ncbi:MAG: gspD [Caulobacteraceae bacterium]|nr:gspD [Caulobacteraceae bacterium]